LALQLNIPPHTIQIRSGRPRRSVPMQSIYGRSKSEVPLANEGYNTIFYFTNSCISSI
jgi:hypothetical protein